MAAHEGIAERDDLVQVLERFKKDKQELVCLEKSIDAQFKKIAETFRKKNLKNCLYLETEKELVSKLDNTLCITVIGQTNCGKSSVINELLESSVVPAKQTPCTARLVQLTFSENPSLCLVKKIKNDEGLAIGLDEVDETPLEKNYIPSEKINLTGDDRNDPLLVDICVKARINNDFLRAGVDIFDSPGWDENHELNRIVWDHLKNSLPLIVYVIDGQNLLTLQDKSDISEINEIAPYAGSIFYVVNKCDPSGEEDDDDEMDEYSDLPLDIRVPKRKMKRVYDVLCEEGFLPKGIDMEDCPLFHGISARRIKENRRAAKKNPGHVPNDRCRYYVEGFNRLKECLRTYVKDMLDQLVRDACETLISSVSRCLNFLVRETGIDREIKYMLEKQFREIGKQEVEMYSKIQKAILEKKQDMKNEIASRINQSREVILTDIIDTRKFKYNESGFSIQEGYVSASEAVKRCEAQIRNFIVNKLSGEIDSYIHCIFKDRDNTIKNIAKQIEDFEKRISDNSTASVVLTQSMFACYHYRNLNEGKVKTLSIWRRAINVVRSLGRKSKQFVKLLVGKVPVGTDQWKKEAAIYILDGIRADEIASDLTKSLQTFFEDSHTMFQEKFNAAKELCRYKSEAAAGIRLEIKGLASDLAAFEFQVYSIYCKNLHGPLQYGEEIGRGAQGTVYKGRFQENQCAIKEMKNVTRIQMKAIALEVHYTRMLDHPNIVSVIGGSLAPEDSAIVIYYNLMKTDLQRLLPDTDLLKKLTYAYDAAKGLQYLHQQGVFHRDVKAANVLVDFDDTAKLGDFGFCKPMGMANDSFVGTPVHIAPELMKGQMYDTSVDVYSFGVMLWYVCEKTGHSHPRNAILNLLLGPLFPSGCRPEQRPEFTESCWRLMSRCWKDPEQRPDMNEVAQGLNKILQDLRHDDQQIAATVDITLHIRK